VPLGIRLFGIGRHLAELIADLRGEADGRPVDDSPTGPEIQRFIDTLNRDFGNLREVLQDSEPSLTAALIDPVIDRFTETLSAVASAHADLAAKCESLTGSLARFLDPSSSEPTWESDDSDSQS
jgi:ABC-type transporter Mla subunit MlaD